MIINNYLVELVGLLAFTPPPPGGVDALLVYIFKYLLDSERGCSEVVEKLRLIVCIGSDAGSSSGSGSNHAWYSWSAQLGREEVHRLGGVLSHVYIHL